MAPKFAKEMPVGFTNRIERVAIVGAGGSVGAHLTGAVLKTGKHIVTAITRKSSKNKLPDGVKIAYVDYDNEDSLVSALRGQQFLVISMAHDAPSDTQEKLIEAAAKAGVPWIMPNCYSTDFENESLMEENLTGPAVIPGMKIIDKVGASSWIAMGCSFWYEFSLGSGPAWYGFDFANKKVTFYDDGKTAIDTTTWPQCGRALAALLSLKELPEDENDTSVTISKWRNKGLWISSFFVSQRDMLDSVERVTSTTDKDWTIEYEPSKARWERAMEKLKSGDRSGFPLALYSRTLYPNGDGDLRSKKEMANEPLGLPQEDIDEATKRAIEISESGYNYFSR